MTARDAKRRHLDRRQLVTYHDPVVGSPNVCLVPGCSGHLPGAPHRFHKRLTELNRKLAELDRERAVVEREHRLLLAIATMPRTAPVTAPQAPMMLTRAQVAEALGVSPHAVWELYNAGKLRGVKVGRKLRFDVLDVLRFVGRKG